MLKWFKKIFNHENKSDLPRSSQGIPIPDYPRPPRPGQHKKSDVVPQLDKIKRKCAQIPLIIMVEGVDYVGKSSAIEHMVEVLNNTGLKVEVCREPGSTEFGEEIRSITKKYRDLDITTESLAFTLSRYEMYAKKVVPALKVGKVVILDRSMISTFVYQSKDLDNVVTLCNMVNKQLEDLKPYTICYLLEDTPEVLERRRKERLPEDKYEEETNFKEKMQQYEKVVTLLNSDMLNKKLNKVFDEATILQLAGDNTERNKNLIQTTLLNDMKRIVEKNEEEGF